jgi:hypothetical protein
MLLVKLCFLNHLCSTYIYDFKISEKEDHKLLFNVYWSVHCNSIIVYNFNKMHKSQSLFNLTTALHVSDVTITHLQEHKTTVTTASGNRYTVLLSAAVMEELEVI